MVAGERWGPEAINVADQRREQGSLLNWMERLIRMPQQKCLEIGWGGWQLLDSPHKGMLALRYDVEGRTVITIHNLSRRRCRTSLDLGAAEDWLGLIDLFDGTTYERAAGRALGAHARGLRPALAPGAQARPRAGALR